MDRNRGGVRAVGGITAVVEANKTRPADTTQYAAGDVINESTTAGTVWTFANCGRTNGGTGIVLGAVLTVSTDPTTDYDTELWLFDAEPATANDNAAFAPTDAELRDLVCIIEFDTAFAGSGNLAYQKLGLNAAFKCATDAKDLYGVLVTRSTTTPASGDRFDIRLTLAQD